MDRAKQLIAELKDVDEYINRHEWKEAAVPVIKRVMLELSEDEIIDFCNMLKVRFPEDYNTLLFYVFAIFGLYDDPDDYDEEEPPAMTIEELKVLRQKTQAHRLVGLFADLTYS